MFGEVIKEAPRSRGVLYFLVGSKHACQLVVSMMSLRERYHGPISLVVADDAARTVGEKVAADDRLGAELIEWEPPEGKGKGHWHCAKTCLPQLSPYDDTMLLDADTLVVGDIEPFWPTGREIVHLSRFADWVTTGSKMKKRIEGWRDYAPREVARALCYPYPALNTGTMAWRSDATGFLDKWREFGQGHVSFMGDELAAQLIFLDYPHTVFDHRWNFSPCYSLEPHMKPWEQADVRIVHFHGFSHARPDKSEFGAKLWYPYYTAAVENRYACIDDWGPGNDKHLKAYLKSQHQTAR